MRRKISARQSIIYLAEAESHKLLHNVLIVVWRTLVTKFVLLRFMF